MRMVHREARARNGEQAIVAQADAVRARANEQRNRKAKKKPKIQKRQQKICFKNKYLGTCRAIGDQGAASLRSKSIEGKQEAPEDLDDRKLKL